jgi:cullin-associated NEDD8-dissociated protein 1
VNILQLHPNAASVVKEKIFPKTLDLAESALLQGLALDSLLQLYGDLVRINASNFGFDFLINSVLALSEKQLQRQSYASLAQCVAAICSNGEASQRNAIVARFISDLQSSKKETAKLLALQCLGEIGRRVDLSNHGNLHEVILGIFDSSEETMLPNAASFALGNIAVGNLSKYLPIILSDIDKHQSRQYLLLHSLKEVISRQSVSQEKVRELHQFLDGILPILLRNAESKEDGTRNVVAECLGKLALINPQPLIKKFVELVASECSQVRSTVITALKFMIVEQIHPIDAELQSVMPTFLSLLHDKDLVKTNLIIFKFSKKKKKKEKKLILSF